MKADSGPMKASTSATNAAEVAPTLMRMVE